MYAGRPSCRSKAASIEPGPESLSAVHRRKASRTCRLLSRAASSGQSCCTQQKRSLELELGLVEHADIVRIFPDVREDVGSHGGLRAVRRGVGCSEKRQNALACNLSLSGWEGAEVEKRPERKQARVAVLELGVFCPAEDVGDALLLG
eukprot:scaffold107916_cov25-Prasinocladus_malaysianus.AAC.1